MSLEGVEWKILKSSGVMSVLPFGMVSWSSVIILCISSLCNNLSDYDSNKISDRLLPIFWDITGLSMDVNYDS
jgi:hypothetical protein